ncbi:inositol polyphosphate 5-phosphatase OCRL-like isoform X2 [Mya arenaria]|uniref:inositol polyphosphate 5-phosphatase OCRL-like isoform X2 n=1 Tax=Mya arenaria TaxID=6604 RepID=UPI0022E47F9C|nr:inositol polyphosphate 5-phosphatase OCRL-like isoform X2 [Mya arenaria]
MADAAASVHRFVKQKLSNDEICLLCVEGKELVEGAGKIRKFVCLIERQGDHAVFVYVSKSVPCQTSEDLRLENVFPISEALRVVTEIPQTVQDGYMLALQNDSNKCMFELSQENSSKNFIVELKNKMAIQSQNAAFALPSTFSWLEKYSTKLLHPGPTPSGEDNPFQNDVFDPLKYMQLDNSGSNVSVEKASNELDGFEDDFFNLALTSSGSSQQSNSELTESLDQVAQKQLGLKPGANMAAGLKPLSAREKLVEHQLKNRQSEFVEIQNFRVFVGTWNVNGQATTNLDEWLACDKEPPDIYAIGFQELDLSNQAYIFSDSAREAEWQDAVAKHLHPRAVYQKLKSIRLVGVLLMVFIKDIHWTHVNLIDSDYVATGIMGMLGNKGGVGVRFSLHDSTLLFINSHLAAHQEEYERRNQDAFDIESKMKFKRFLPPLTVQDHDVVFWLGDLNYRIDQDITVVKDCVAQGRLHKLLPHDQLRKHMSTNIVYKSYSEGEINFPPTYRYDTGTDNFDTSEKARNPAWCDRVLWKGSGVRQIIYRSHPALKISDHKPVSSLFDTGIKVVLKEKYKKVYEDIMKQLDRLENDYLPQVSLTQREFLFLDVKFMEPHELILAVANTGQIPVTFEFINKPDEDTYCKPWLKVSPSSAVIEPGDSVEIFLEVLVDHHIAYQFNCGHQKIEDILVLHLHGGKDFFIPISGNYIVSSFGSSIEALVQMHGPIREVPTADLVNMERPGSLDNVDTHAVDTRLLAAPKEIFRLVDHIWQYGKHQEDLFQQQGLNTEMHQIRDCLDTGTPEQLPGGIHSVCEALLLFLESLAEPVIPYSLYENCISVSNNHLLCKQVMSEVPLCHRNVFKYLCAFLRQLLEESKYNNLDIKYLCPLFGDKFLRPPPVRMTKSRRTAVKSEDMKKAAFLYHFLVRPYDE